MSAMRRLVQKLKGLSEAKNSRVDAEMERELATHVALLEEELIRKGAEPAEARRQARLRLGGVEQVRMMHREARGLPLIESLIADVRFGWRQLMKRKVTTLAAVLSLGLAMGACMAAFLLIDAFYLRPLPVSDPSHLYVAQFEGLNWAGAPGTWNAASYPMFEKMRDAAKDLANVTALGYTSKNELTYGGYQQMEQAYQQPVSGEMFGLFGLKPALGRLIGPEDNLAPKQSPAAVLSYEYWQRRFEGDTQVVGKHFRKGDDDFEIVGVAPKGFTGTELGLMADIFTPSMMEPWVADKNDRDQTLFVRPKSGVTLATVQSVLDATYQREEQERAKMLDSLPENLRATFPNAHLRLQTVGSGVSGLKEGSAPSLETLSILIVLVLMIACANVANLMSAQSAARSREMAVRVSLGSGRSRLVRMVLVESTMLGVAAAALGLLFAWWAAPFILTKMTPADFPVRVALPMDWIVAGFAVALMMAVTLIFGMFPAARASHVYPAQALKGGEAPQAHQRAMHGLIAVQIAFCFIVLFIAGLFATSLARKTGLPLGFATEHVLVMETTAKQPIQMGRWDALLEAVRGTPGVQNAAMADRTLMGWSSQSTAVTVDGVTRKEVNAFLLKLSPGWIETMGIPLLAGRDIRDSDRDDTAALVNQAFVKTYFGGKDPVGRMFTPLDSKTPVTVVGVVGDAMYGWPSRTVVPQVYQPMPAANDSGSLKPLQMATLVVKTQMNDPMAMAETLRKTIMQTDASLRVVKVQSQRQVVDGKFVQERLHAATGEFFAAVALLLAAVGLYGVLHYSVILREREIGVRIALGATAGNIARTVTARVLAMVLLGTVAGSAAGLGLVRFITSMLYQVKGADPSMMMMPAIVLMGAALLAALPVVARAMRINPVVMLRSE